jgi:hypothetical protein
MQYTDHGYTKLHHTSNVQTLSDILVQVLSLFYVQVLITDTRTHPEAALFIKLMKMLLYQLVALPMTQLKTMITQQTMP